MKLRIACVLVAFLSLVLSLTPLTVCQTPAQTASALPRLVRFGGAFKDLNGSPLTGVVGITFAFYSEKTGGAPLWLETQNATVDSTGHYTVLLGATRSEGLPADLFTTEQARWVGVQVAGQPEQPRVLLVSAPYALKAGDAETLGGLPPSAFVLAAPVVSGSATSSSTTEGLSPAVATDVTTTGGTANYLPIFNGAATIIDSAVFQTGSATTAKVGINTTTPVTQLDVNGGGTIRGTLSLPATGNATAAGGKNSQGLNIVASSFSSTSGTAQSQVFRWQAEPAANDTTGPSGTLNLQYGLGTAAPTETGLKISSKGIFTFATGQTFPGTGVGSVKSVGLTAPATDFTVSGSPVTGTGTLNFAWKVAPTNADTANAIVKRDSTGSFSAGSITAGFVGALNPTGVGIVGTSNGASAGSDGVDGVTTSASASGVAGINNGGGVGVYGVGGTGVFGTATDASGRGGYFPGFSAAQGSNQFGSDGMVAEGGNADPSSSLGGGNGVVGYGGTGGSGFNGSPGNDGGAGGAFFAGPNADGIYAQTTNGYYFAGNFGGDVNITDVLFASSKEFKIDHPLDPANKYLFHASVESSEMMNIYSGNVITDSQGHATVQLPEWFEVLNTDFRYQLTVIGQFAQAIVGHEIENNRFEIRTSAPNVKVSWQVTGVRHDAYAKAHSLVVEEEKEAQLRGFYIHPELYGAPPEKQIEWARHPQMMKRKQEMRARQLAAAQKQAAPRN
jgi:trimeric autotransporter adhesin